LELGTRNLELELGIGTWNSELELGIGTQNWNSEFGIWYLECDEKVCFKHHLLTQDRPSHVAYDLAAS